MKKIITLFLLLHCGLAVASTDSLKEFYPEKGFYVDNGYGFGLLLKHDDRDVLKDSIWIDARVGYQFRKNIGLHLEGSYFISSMRNVPVVVDVTYFKIGPGVKLLFPIRDGRFSIFGDVMVGYGRMHASADSLGVSASKGGVATAMDVGLTYKIQRWVGLSPYVALDSITGKVNGGQATSFWFISGAMANFFF